jgi:hypothetical protein
MKYYVDGYTPPEDVMSYEDVKRYQKLLGVEVDGIWGKKTQAAYEKYLMEKNKQNDNEGYPFGSGVDWEAISKKLTEYFSNVMRPTIDAAIEKRKAASDTFEAELDADSYARGMGGSTFVSSMKARQEESEQDDIAYLESEYSQALAAQVYDSLMKLGSMYAEQKMKQEELELQREKMRQEREMFEEQLRVKERSAAKQNDSAYFSGLKYSDYERYIDSLGAQAEDFFLSQHEYWRYIRAQAKLDLGESGYNQLYNSFMQSRQAKNDRGRDKYDNVEELY